MITQPAAERYREASVDEWAEVHIRAYAATEALLAYALRHEPGAMEALLREIETKYDRPDNPYVEAARRLWQTHRGTRDPLAVCEAMSAQYGSGVTRQSSFVGTATTRNSCRWSASVRYMRARKPQDHAEEDRECTSVSVFPRLWA